MSASESVSVAVSATDDGTYWLDVDGDRRTFEMDSTDGRPQSVTFEVESVDEPLELRVRGGRVD